MHTVDIRGEQVPISKVTWEQMCDPAAVFPLGYDFNELPLETQGAAMLAPLEVVRLLGSGRRAILVIGGLLR